jgi:hypothetical protein
MPSQMRSPKKAACSRGRPGGRHYSWRVLGGCFVVLVDEAAEPVATADLAGR